MSLKSSAGILLLTLLFVTEAFSLPRFAVRLGDKCIDCHYNPTGGMMRNEDGWNFGKNIMSAITPRDQDFATTPKIADNISFGLDYRTQFLYSEQKDRTDFQQMTGSIYTNVGLAKILICWEDMISLMKYGKHTELRIYFQTIVILKLVHSFQTMESGLMITLLTPEVAICSCCPQMAIRD